MSALASVAKRLRVLRCRPFFPAVLVFFFCGEAHLRKLFLVPAVQESDRLVRRTFERVLNLRAPLSDRDDPVFLVISRRSLVEFLPPLGPLFVLQCDAPQ